MSNVLCHIALFGTVNSEKKGAFRKQNHCSTKPLLPNSHLNRQHYRLKLKQRFGFSTKKSRTSSSGSKPISPASSRKRGIQVLMIY